NDTLTSSIELEREIQNVIDENDTEYDDGNPLDIEVSIGNPIRPNRSEPQGIRETFDRAVARATSRASTKKSETRPISIRPVGT
ncbi:MAG: hypothetical protein Q7U14_07615, partial [Lacisediminimonas sp.]|nr:hypothetical protein [Lacisediminimonas sp.]